MAKYSLTLLVKVFCLAGYAIGVGSVATADNSGQAEDSSAQEAGHFERNPSDPDPEVRAQQLVETADAHAQAGDELSAARAYQRALELQPALSSARQGYARILMMSNRSERARHVLREGIEEGDNSEFSARFYAHLAEQAGEQDEAISILKKFSARNDSEAGAIEAHLAALHRQIGQHDQALMYYSRLARHEPDNGIWPAGQALAAEAMGDKESALRAWQRAVELGLSAEIASYAESRIEQLRD
ncbi:tetratricopeptide repeat protein [Halorhodospira halochloris]|uniref:tetratricopeptide repeat protein n=1 Tax=Halorhodospira halochloris TaxID=1052 RepID=UPI001EE89E55|nr:tetratricopeptide repeat protein [Halorhodospira halochloris]MCG5547746.1 tetratricopeptide repeat protein [Halorhodospira halochloris]